MLIVPTSVTAFVRKAVTARMWTGAIAALTVGFAIGQCIGPWVSGVVSDARYGVAGGLLLSGGVLAGAALCRVDAAGAARGLTSAAQLLVSNAAASGVNSLSPKGLMTRTPLNVLPWVRSSVRIAVHPASAAVATSKASQ